MSKMGQAVFSGQQIAEGFYNVTRSEFTTLAKEQFGLGTVSYSAAVDAYDEIQNEMGSYLAELDATDEDVVPAIFDTDGIPY